jgi:DNA-binding NarL/FixJ family response regulator
MTVRVILADDQPLVRAGLRMLIEQTPDIDVAGEAGTGAEVVQLARDTGPDVVVAELVVANDDPAGQQPGGDRGSPWTPSWSRPGSFMQGLSSL